MARSRLTSFRLPYMVEEMQQASLVVGNRGQSGALGSKTVTALELLDGGGVVATFEGSDKRAERWVFSSHGYGRLLDEPAQAAVAPSKAKAGKEVAS